MNKSPSRTKREYTPLHPNRPVVVVRGDEVICLEPNEVTRRNVGLKAYGLASIPPLWTRPFIVVSSEKLPEQSALLEAFDIVSMDASLPVLVRSSGCEENISNRGNLVSGDCAFAGITDLIVEFQKQIKKLSDVDPGTVHWVLQSYMKASAQGHLSNERRLSRHLRDWVVEVEASRGYPPEVHCIAIRHWRDARHPSTEKLICPYRAIYIERLEDVARWAYDNQSRIHFEWIWDGDCVYVVQADECDISQGGVNPKDLVDTSSQTVHFDGLNLFRVATSEDLQKYSKLANAKMYTDLGYKMPEFFVLDDQQEIRRIVAQGGCGPSIQGDLKKLTAKPLVIRTDGLNIPSDQRQMLPRSDELRSEHNAMEWLLGPFATRISEGGLLNANLCLIAHHFIPSTASAWCQAFPDKRRVRIESLWGIPEGLYWYAYDSFDVDTLVVDPPTGASPPKHLKFRERIRYKGRFVAPDKNGSWVLNTTKQGPDWQRSIKKQDWIDEIAWTSRRIAAKAGRPVVVMWFVDIPKSVSQHKVLPWYHEFWESHHTRVSAVPKKYLKSSRPYTIRSREDWDDLQRTLEAGGRVSRVLINPDKPDLIRDREFAKSLAALAVKHDLVVELEGGILSHAFYLLTRAGCTVESADLESYATESEEIQFNKLVRDKIPEEIRRRGEDVAEVALDKEAIILALRRKLIEEAFEVYDAITTQRLIEELADLKEVMNALARRLEIDVREIDRAARKKVKERGGFDDGLMLERTGLPSPLQYNEEAELPMEMRVELRERRRISSVDQLPRPSDNVHIDRRETAEGQKERQFTFTIPIYASDIVKPNISFSLPTSAGIEHEMTLVITLERLSGDFRCRIRVQNMSGQLDLPFKD